MLVNRAGEIGRTVKSKRSRCTIRTAEDGQNGPGVREAVRGIRKGGARSKKLTKTGGGGKRILSRQGGGRLKEALKCVVIA